MAVDTNRPSPTANPCVRLLLLAVLLVAGFLRFRDLTLQNIWWDEARNIDVALRPFWAIPNAPELDIHPPLYFWLLHLWSRLLGLDRGDPWPMTAFVARSLSVAAGLAGVALLFRFTRRLGGPRAGLMAALIGALSPFWLAESQEARMYTLGFALLLGAALVFLANEDSIFRSSTFHLPSFIFVLLSALALLTHYSAVFILVAWYLWWGGRALLGADRWRRLRTVILTGLAMTLLVLPAAPIALRQIPGYANPNLTVPTARQYLWENWSGYLGGYAWESELLRVVGIDAWWLWGVLAVALLGTLLTFRTPRTTHHPPRTTHHAFLLAWLLGGLALYYVAVVDRGAFNIRYSSFVTPALYALLGWGVAGLGRIRRWLPLVGAALLLAGLLPADRADLTDARFFREDTAGLAAWLRAETGAGDVILVDQKYPFGFYYDRYAIDPDVTPEGPETAPARYLFVDINTIDVRLTAWAGDARRVFWVEWFESDTDPRGGVAFLLDKYGTLAGEQFFRGYRVRWWTLDPPTDFELASALRPQVHRWRSGLETAEVDAPTGPLAPGGKLPVVIRWRRTAGAITRPLKARVALYNADGGRVAQDDRRILNDRHLAPSEWSLDDRPLNVYLLDTPTDLTPGPYDVRLLVYDAETLEAVELVDAAGAPAGFEPTIGRLEVMPTPP